MVSNTWMETLIYIFGTFWACAFETTEENDNNNDIPDFLNCQQQTIDS